MTQAIGICLTCDNTYSVLDSQRNKQTRNHQTFCSAECEQLHETYVVGSSDDDQYVVEVKQLVEQIYQYDYYVNLFRRCMEKYNLGPDLDGITADGACELLNTFWFALPDGPAIRRTPFFKLCDLAERMFEEA